MGQEGERKRTPDEVSKCLDDIETDESTQLWDEVWGVHRTKTEREAVRLYN